MRDATEIPVSSGDDDVTGGDAVGSVRDGQAHPACAWRCDSGHVEEPPVEYWQNGEGIMRPG